VSIALTVLLLVELAAGGVLYLSWRAHRERVEAFQARVRADRPDQPSAGADAVTPFLSVEILNAQELAARESWAAKRFGTLMPRRIGRDVAERAAGQMAEQLAAEGVRAEVRIVGPQPPTPVEAIEENVAVGTASLREVHTTISAIPFDILDGVAPAPAVRAVHDRITDGVYDTVGAVSRLAGHILRGDRARPGSPEQDPR
jgi:hypothetical protein